MPRRPAPPGVDRRQQILEAALDEFAEQGFDGATTKEIATRADVTQGLIYFYFPSKEDLFAAACEHQSQRILAETFIQEQDRQEKPEIFFVRLITHLIAVMDEPRNTNLLRIMVQNQGSILAKEAFKCERFIPTRVLAQHLLTEIKGYLADQVARGTMRPVDVDLAAQLVTNAIVMSVTRRALGDAALVLIARDTLAAGIADIYLRGLLA